MMAGPLLIKAAIRMSRSQAGNRERSATVDGSLSTYGIARPSLHTASHRASLPPIEALPLWVYEISRIDEPEWNHAKLKSSNYTIVNCDADDLTIQLKRDNVSPK